MCGPKDEELPAGGVSAASHAMMESEMTLALARWSSSLTLIRAISVEGGDSTQLN